MINRYLWAIATAAAFLFLTPTAAATPGVGVSSEPLAHSTLADHDYLVRDITIEPGGSTGWHWHDGTVIGAVKQGTLTHYGFDCGVDGVYSAGDSITEPGGAGHVHIGRNLGPVPVILEVIYINPSDRPLAEDAANPGCPFA